MSGFEVVGVVLGTIPLVISALEHLQGGLSAIGRWRSYKNELRSLDRTLKNENAIFTNTCRILLSGVVDRTEYEELVRDPFGKLWSSAKIKDQIALRLGTDLERFKDTVLDMDVAISALKSKLGLNQEGQVSCYLSL